MKRSELLAYAVALACVLFVGLTCLENYRKARHQDEVSVSMEREVSVDTVAKIAPEPRTTEVVELKVARLPLKVLPPCVNIDTNKCAYVDTLLYNVDSVDVVLPIERKVYADSNYRAVVSGYDVSLDTIEVYNRHETTTYRHFVRGKQKRWGISAVVGYGYTPQGFQPFVGVALSYRIFSF